jgi:hypothetical protein
MAARCPRCGGAESWSWGRRRRTLVGRAGRPTLRLRRRRCRRCRRVWTERPAGVIPRRRYSAEVEGRADISRYTVCDPQARLEVVAAPPEGEAILAEGKRSGSWGCWRGPTTWSWLTRGATRAEPATALALRSAFDPEARLARSRAERAGQEAGARPEGIWPSRVDSLSDPDLLRFIT